MFEKKKQSHELEVHLALFHFRVCSCFFGVRASKTSDAEPHLCIGGGCRSPTSEPPGFPLEWPGFPGPLLSRVSHGRGPQQDTWVQVPTVVRIHKMTLDNFPPSVGFTFLRTSYSWTFLYVYGCSMPSPAQKATCLMHAKTFSEALWCTGPVTGPGDTRTDEALLSTMGDTLSPVGRWTTWSNDQDTVGGRPGQDQHRPLRDPGLCSFWGFRRAPYGPGHTFPGASMPALPLIICMALGKSFLLWACCLVRQIQGSVHMPPPSRASPEPQPTVITQSC